MNDDNLLYLWEKRSLFVGRLDEPLSMRQGAACLIVSLEAPFSYRVSEQEAAISTLAVLTPPGASYHIDTHGQLVANCMLDPFGEDFHLVKSQTSSSHCASNEARYACEHIDAYRQVFREIYESTASYAHAYQQLDGVLRLGLSDEARPPFSVDPRVVAVINHLKNNISENQSIETLARAANLSVSRLIELFKQQTGIPIRRYRSWHRLFVACVMIAKTGSLTDASQAAGFTDASHFTKTFYSMVGACPSKIFGRHKQVKMFVA